MIHPFKPGHFARGGELLLELIREGHCLDCTAPITGPAVMKRCAKCAAVHKRAQRKRREAARRLAA